MCLEWSGLLTFFFEFALQWNDLLCGERSEPSCELEVDLAENLNMRKMQGHDAQDLDIVEEDARIGGNISVASIVFHFVKR